MSSSEEIKKITQILLANLNKINIFRNLQNINSINIIQFLNELDIDIKNILSLLDIIKFNNKDIIICGNCDCCNLCNCSTNNNSDNQINLSNNNIPDNNYIKEIINQEESNDNVNNNYTYNYIPNSVKNNDNMQHNYREPIFDRMKNSAVMKSKRFQVNKSYDNIKINSSTSPPNKKARIIRHINFLKFNNDDNNIIGNRKIYNNKIMGINMNNNKLDLAAKKQRQQKLLNKLSNQPKEIVERFKKVYGDDIEYRLLNTEINNNNLSEMENILDKIIKMSIWGKEEKNKKKNSADKNKRKRIKFNYNPIQEKVRLKQAITNKQALYKEFPRGWNSTKEYFINNGTAINNDDNFL